MIVVAPIFVVSFLAVGESLWTPTTPASRSKGQIACYSCFSTTAFESSPPIFARRSLRENSTDFVQLIEDAGMTVPALVPRCADIATPGNPNVHGAKVHLCPNSPTKPGACVKFKGYLNGEPFVYRDCWEQMWRDPRPFHHRMSNRCFNDQKVQNFIATADNTLCFCEEDLCNGSVKRLFSLLWVFSLFIWKL